MRMLDIIAFLNAVPIKFKGHGTTLNAARLSEFVANSLGRMRRYLLSIFFQKPAAKDAAVDRVSFNTNH